jgi:membrane protease YdiL (CAAX protease family)
MNSSATAHTNGKRLGIRAGLLQCAGMVALATLISALFGPRPLWAVIAESRSLVRQIGVGTLFAFAFAIPILIAILKINVFRDFRTFALDLPNRADFGGWNPLWLGLCAGAGEELLFRGALQPLLGIWWTGLLFALAHFGTGGFKSMNLMKWGYAAFLVITSLMLGLVMITIGLITAVVLHSVADACIFLALREVAGRQVPRLL